MTTIPSPTERVRPMAARLALPAMALFGIGAMLTWYVVADLPQMQTMRIRGEDLSAAFRNVFQTAPAAAASGIRMIESGGDITAAIMRTRPIDDCAKRCAARAQQTTNTQLPRLQQAALVLLALERMSAPAERQWTAIEPYIGGLGDVSFAHFHRDALDTLAGAVASTGCSPGVAGDIVVMRFGSPHGPFLQHFTMRMLALAEALDQLEGRQAAARQCHVLVLRLLKQWIIEPGPAGLRLQAADLLARVLSPSPAAPAQTTTQTATSASRIAPIAAQYPQASKIAAELAQWTQAYRRELRRRPTAQFDLRRQPTLAPVQFSKMRNSLAMTAWAGGAAAACVALMLGLFWTAFRGRTLSRDGARRAAILGTAGGGFVLLSGIAILIRGETLLADLSWAWMRLPLYSAGMALVMAGLATFLSAAQRAHGEIRERLLAVFCGASAAGLLLGAAFAFFAWTAGTAGRHYDRATAMALRDEIAAVAPDSTEAYLVTLHRWNP
ncbi:MAG: hypothetical protein JNG88_16335 [Phycisphaerales bacterium]|nr:hypothetical protein [Phycisphaerales bacterium]